MSMKKSMKKYFVWYLSASFAGHSLWRHMLTKTKKNLLKQKKLQWPEVRRIMQKRQMLQMVRRLVSRRLPMPGFLIIVVLVMKKHWRQRRRN